MGKTRLLGLDAGTTLHGQHDPGGVFLADGRSGTEWVDCPPPPPACLSVPMHRVQVVAGWR